MSESNSEIDTTASRFKLGNKVTWTETRVTSTRSGQKMNISTKEGKVECVNDEVVTVIYRKKYLKIHHTRLRHVGQQTELTEAFVKQR